MNLSLSRVNTNRCTHLHPSIVHPHGAVSLLLYQLTTLCQKKITQNTFNPVFVRVRLNNGKPIKHSSYDHLILYRLLVDACVKFFFNNLLLNTDHFRATHCWFFFFFFFFFYKNSFSCVINTVSGEQFNFQAHQPYARAKSVCSTPVSSASYSEGRECKFFAKKPWRERVQILLKILSTVFCCFCFLFVCFIILSVNYFYYKDI